MKRIFMYCLAGVSKPVLACFRPVRAGASRKAISYQSMNGVRRLTFPSISVAVALLYFTPAEARDKSGGNYGRINLGPTGIYGSLLDGSPHFTVEAVADGSPASEKVMAGDVVTSINGKPLDGFPANGWPASWYRHEGTRYTLGSAITKAEATDGVLKLGITRNKRDMTVDLKIPVLGAYSSTWPVDCKKSEKIVEGIAEFLKGIQDPSGRFVFPAEHGPAGSGGGIGQDLAGLFLMSTGDEKDMPAVRKFASTRFGPPGNSSWSEGYRGLFLGEYYLRTGDPKARDALAQICKALAANDKVGSWPHQIDACRPGYVRGGLMNQSSVICFMSYLLARECGIHVDDAGFIRTLTFFYKFAGKGATPYGDHRPEEGASGNGKGPSTACAYSLMNDDRATRAGQLLAVGALDGYYGFESGHTGNGFNIIWRGIAAPHVPKEWDAHRRTCMNALAWYYDLVRQCDGSLRLLPAPDGENRYASTTWGTGGLGLHYTAFRKTLRITGKPRGPNNANPMLPPDPQWRWYERPETDFLKVDYCKGGGDLGIPQEELYHRDLTVEQCAVLMRHYWPGVRTHAAHQLARIAGPSGAISPKALDAIEAALKDPDARVQRAALDAISGYHPWSSISGKIPTLVTPKEIGQRFAPYLVRILKDPNAEMWVKDSALWAMARADAKTIMKNQELIAGFDTHELWWLRQSARWCVWGLAQEGAVSYKTIKGILEAKQKEGRSFASGDLTKCISICVSGSRFTDAQRKEVLRMMMADRLGERGPLQDAYGYDKAPAESYSVDNLSNFYYTIAEFTAQEHVMTFPLLVKMFDAMVTEDDPITFPLFMIFEGVKRFKGIHGKLTEVGVQARPVFARMKQFIMTNEKDIARDKYDPEKPERRVKQYDEIIIPLFTKMVADYEAKHGKL